MSPKYLLLRSEDPSRVSLVAVPLTQHFRDQLEHRGEIARESFALDPDFTGVGFYFDEMFVYENGDLEKVLGRGLGHRLVDNLEEVAADLGTLATLRFGEMVLAPREQLYFRFYAKRDPELFSTRKVSIQDKHLFPKRRD